MENRTSKVFVVMEMLVLVTRSVVGGSAVFELVRAEFVIGINKKLQNSFESVTTSEKASAAALQTGDISSQIGIDAFDNVSISFIMAVTYIFCSIVVYI
jgi:hypothetical protein